MQLSTYSYHGHQNEESGINDIKNKRQHDVTAEKINTVTIVTNNKKTIKKILHIKQKHFPHPTLEGLKSNNH